MRGRLSRKTSQPLLNVTSKLQKLVIFLIKVRVVDNFQREFLNSFQNNVPV